MGVDFTSCRDIVKIKLLLVLMMKLFQVIVLLLLVDYMDYILKEMILISMMELLKEYQNQ